MQAPRWNDDIQNVAEIWFEGTPSQESPDTTVPDVSDTAEMEKYLQKLFNVADLHMHWHDEGHFLCVKVA